MSRPARRTDASDPELAALRTRKEAARATLLAAYVAGDQARIDAAVATMREWCKARGLKDRRRKR
jgi:hypothetical protein